MKQPICLGDATSSGGKTVAVLGDKAVAVLGDKATCP